MLVLSITSYHISFHLDTSYKFKISKILIYLLFNDHIDKKDVTLLLMSFLHWPINIS